MSGERTLCLWWPDWPVVALRRAERVPLEGPVVVMGEGGRVRAVSAEARAGGVCRGLRRREAEARCPAAAVAEWDPPLESREFEAVARALEAVTHRLALGRPGLLWFPMRGPTRVFGGEEAVVDAVLRAAPGGRVGVAQGGFAAALAARETSEDSPAGSLDEAATAEFLASRSIRVLRERGMDELAGLFRRLGLRTLGDLAALSERSVGARFGAEGLRAHRLARGLDDAPAALAAPPPEGAETAELDPPVDRVDAALFAARGLAARLRQRLEDRGLLCTAVTVEAETEHGERLARLWRMAETGVGTGTEAALVQRVRWQLEAWAGSLTAGLSLIRLVPEEVVAARAFQLDFFSGGWGESDARAGPVLTRLQGMLGHEAVVQPALRGGRTPAEQTSWVPYGDPIPPGRALAPVHPHRGEYRGEYRGERQRPSGKKHEGPTPWPGAVPSPAPALVYDPPLAARLLDAEGRAIAVSGRGELSAPPAHLACAGLTSAGGTGVDDWVGPWPQDVRFWDASAHRRRALFQVVAGGVAYLVGVSGGQAAVEAVYD